MNNFHEETTRAPVALHLWQSWLYCRILIPSLSCRTNVAHCTWYWLLMTTTPTPKSTKRITVLWDIYSKPVQVCPATNLVTEVVKVRLFCRCVQLQFIQILRLLVSSFVKHSLEKLKNNKKVLLHERKRHTARRVASAQGGRGRGYLPWVPPPPSWPGRGARAYLPWMEGGGRYLPWGTPSTVLIWLGGTYLGWGCG